MITKGDRVKIKSVPTEDSYYPSKEEKEDYLTTVGKKGVVTYVVQSDFPTIIFDVKLDINGVVYSYEEHELEKI